MSNFIKQDYLSDNLNYFLFGALAFSVSSAWNSAFQNYFKENRLLKDRGPWLYAVFISIFAIVVACILREATKKIKNVEKFLRNKTDDEDQTNNEIKGKTVILKERNPSFYNNTNYTR